MDGPRACLAAALALAGAGAVLPPAADGKDYGRWRLSLTGEIHKQWSAPDTTPCAITGQGAGDLRFNAVRTIRLRWIPKGPRFPAHWDAGGNSVAFRAEATGSTAADATQQPPSGPEGSCAWPSPSTWRCGPFSYSASSELHGGWLPGRGHPSGLVVMSSTHGSGLSPSSHLAADSRDCFAGSSMDYTLGDRFAGKALFLRLPGPSVVAARHRLTVSEHTGAADNGLYDESAGAFRSIGQVQRSAHLVLTRQ
jgi:hypothetical protein